MSTLFQVNLRFRRMNQKKYVFRPVGTIENAPRNAGFARPYGTRTIMIAHIPSSELLGYHHTSLRDGTRQMHLCRTTRAGAPVTQPGQRPRGMNLPSRHVSVAALALLLVASTANAIIMHDGAQSDPAWQQEYIGLGCQYSSVGAFYGHDGTQWRNCGSGVVISDHHVLGAAHVAHYSNFASSRGTTLRTTPGVGITPLTSRCIRFTPESVAPIWRSGHSRMSLQVTKSRRRNSTPGVTPNCLFRLSI